MVLFEFIAESLILFYNSIDEQRTNEVLYSIANKIGS